MSKEKTITNIEDLKIEIQLSFRKINKRLDKIEKKLNRIEEGIEKPFTFGPL